METKKPWLSKTLILNLVVAISAMAMPSVAEFIKEHPDVVMASFAAINFALRLITKDKVGLEE